MAGDQPDLQATDEVQAQLAATETAASSGHVGIVAAIMTPTSKRARPTDRNFQVPEVQPLRRRLPLGSIDYNACTSAERT